VRTFSIGFDVPAFNEAEHARQVARHLGTEHTELYVTEQDARDVIPLLPSIYDEPFSDSSQIPTYLVSKLARRHVTVSLSGDGGDELFAGYNRHVWGDRLWNRMRAIPRPARRMVSRALTSVPPAVWDRRAAAVPLLRSSKRLGAAHLGHKLHKLAEVLGADRPDRMYLGFASHWKQPSDVVLGGHEPPTLVTDPRAWLDAGSFTERMMYLDLVTYLPDDILVKVDRASMAVGLEARVPLLDHRVVEFAWRLPLELKLRDGVGKAVLRDVLYRYVPRTMIERPKAGFGVPLKDWLRGPLREWAEALLAPDRLRADGFFDPTPVRAAWDEHLSGRRDRQYDLWDVLMFQAWYHDGGRVA
jgi:asparagine synthase (glutamine-hydrolysing)